MRILIVSVVMFACMMSAGCRDTVAAPARDFNELIPRLMRPVNTYNDPVTAAENLFNVTSPDERRDAIAYLSTKPYGHDSAYMKAYYLLTTDPHAMVRGQAMRALGASQKSDAIPYLIKGLGDAESQVRRDAARGLMDTYDDSAITALADRMLKDSDDQTRVACAKALKQAKTPEAYRALIEALSDPNAAVVVNAHKALTANTGQTLGHNPRPWLEWYQQTHVKTAAPPTP
ncbi:MAG: HEAT repeat domain-containing protein [Phycisphaerales bacterium]|nr:HEAT repeat domain-containing protein [Phycisphaerales bacterium]